MAKEIERKFLVRNDSYKQATTAGCHIVQAYLSARPEATVRLRVVDDERAFLTVKGRNDGAVRDEWEYAIPLSDALEMLGRCATDGRIIDKTRRIADAGGGLRWEIDEFHGNLEGLVLAEIELPAPDAAFERPDFIGEEVTGDPRYYNSVLAGL